MAVSRSKPPCLIYHRTKISIPKISVWKIRAITNIVRSVYGVLPSGEYAIQLWWIPRVDETGNGKCSNRASKSKVYRQGAKPWTASAVDTAGCGKPHVRWCGRDNGRNPVISARSKVFYIV